MKKYILFACLVSLPKLYANMTPFPANNWLGKHYAGVDMCQFGYLAGGRPMLSNYAIMYQYRAFRFFNINASFFSNNVHTKPVGNYVEMTEYASRGLCFKLGGQFNLRLSRNKASRIFLGYQGALIHYQETGNFAINQLYWGNHKYSFDKKYPNQFAMEYIIGFQFGRERIVFQPQIYAMFDRHIRKVSSHNEVLDGYRSPFIPGFGYKKAGLNFLILYRFN